MAVRKAFLAALVVVQLSLCVVGCNRQPAPTTTTSDVRPLLNRARAALEAAPTYRWTSRFSIQSGDAEGAATLVADGERTREPAASSVEVRGPDAESPEGGWVQIGAESWLYTQGTWTRLPAPTGDSPIASLAFLDPARLWDALDDEGVESAELLGEEPVGDYETRHFRLTRRDTAFLPAGQFTPTGAVIQELWLDDQSDLPIKTSLALEGSNAEGLRGQMALEIELRDVGAPITIAPPAEVAEGDAGEGAAESGTARITESLEDGTALPLAPGAEEGLPGPLPAEIQTLVESFALLGDAPTLALQLYTTPEPVESLAAFFEQTLTGQGYGLDQRTSGVFTENATVLLFSSAERNVQVVLIPLEGRTMVVTTLQ